MGHMRLPLRIEDESALIDAVDSYMECADWYRRCLEDVADRRPVCGLDEAQEGYHHSRKRLSSILEDVDPEPADRRMAESGRPAAPSPGEAAPSTREGS